MRNLMLGIVLAVVLAAPAWAETYMWVDNAGVTNFSDNYESIPKQFRGKATALGGVEQPFMPAESPDGAAETPGASDSAPAAKKPAAKAAASGQAGGSKQAEKSYGGKEASEWRYQHAKLAADVKSLENSVADGESRQANPVGMNRQAYLYNEYELKNYKTKLEDARRKLQQFEDEAQQAGVPSSLFKE